MVPYFVQEVVGDISGMPGVFISCVFSASLSTVSATMNSLSGIMYNDYIRPYKVIKHTDATANFCMKSITFLCGVFCILGGIVVENFSSIFQMVNTIVGCCVGSVFGVFSLGVLYPWANKTVKLRFYGFFGWKKARIHATKCNTQYFFL